MLLLKFSVIYTSLKNVSAFSRKFNASLFYIPFTLLYQLFGNADISANQLIRGTGISRSTEGTGRGISCIRL